MKTGQGNKIAGGNPTRGRVEMDIKFMNNTQRRLEEPTGKDLIDPLFNAVWDAIKGWDLEREQGAGYAGATGTDVMTILNAVRPSITQAVAEERERVVKNLNNMLMLDLEEQSSITLGERLEEYIALLTTR